MCVFQPFGRGMITVVVPQLRRGENSLFLWHLDDLKQPAHTFVGHTDVVLEFQWRKKTDGKICHYCQNVTFSSQILGLQLKNGVKCGLEMENLQHSRFLQGGISHR